MCILFFFFKQKTAYELRISDWSSDVCSSDLSAFPPAWAAPPVPALRRVRRAYMPQGSKTQQGLLSSGQRAIAVYVAAAPSMNCLFMSQTSALKPGLSIVATPIGNLGELSPRAADTLAPATATPWQDSRVPPTQITPIRANS